MEAVLSSKTFAPTWYTTDYYNPHQNTNYHHFMKYFYKAYLSLQSFFPESEI
jgi:hypothetical protein